jgi:hypothetical protein
MTMLSRSPIGDQQAHRTARRARVAPGVRTGGTPAINSSEQPVRAGDGSRRRWRVPGDRGGRRWIRSRGWSTAPRARAGRAARAAFADQPADRLSRAPSLLTAAGLRRSRRCSRATRSSRSASPKPARWRAAAADGAAAGAAGRDPGRARQWVRNGGHLLLLADPALEWPSERARRHSQAAFGFRRHRAAWPLGASARFSGSSRPSGNNRYWTGGRFERFRRAASSRPAGKFSVGSDGFVARCRIGQGKATVIADADFSIRQSRRARIKTQSRLSAPELERLER